MDLQKEKLLDTSTYKNLQYLKIYLLEVSYNQSNNPAKPQKSTKLESFFVQEQKDRIKEFIIQISKRRRHKNIKLLISLPVIYTMNICYQHINQSYIYAYDLERDVFAIPEPKFRLSLHIILKLIKSLYERKNNRTYLYDITEKKL